MKNIKNKSLIIVSVFLIILLCGCSSASVNDVAKTESTEVLDVLKTTEMTSSIESTTMSVEKMQNIKEAETAKENSKNTKLSTNESNKLQKLFEANTVESLLKNYLSFQVFDYALNKDGAKTTYYECYEDKRGNRALRLKDSSTNTEYPFEKVPYYVKTKGGAYEEVINKDSSPLPKNHWLNNEYKNLDTFEIGYGRKSLARDDMNILSDESNADVGIFTAELSYDKLSEKDKKYYENVIKVSGIDVVLKEYQYDKNTLAIKKITDIVICSDGTDFMSRSIDVVYDVDILTPVKVVNDEEGQVVYFDTKKLEKANTYSNIKKDIVSISISDKKYDKNGVVRDTFIYKDEDGNIVARDTRIKENGEDINNPVYHVKYERKWYDIINGEVKPTIMTEEENNRYELDPVNFITNTKSLIDSTEKVVTSYEDNGIGVIVQEENNLSNEKLYIASALPGIGDVVKTRKETHYNMDDDIVISYSITSYTKNGESYKVEDCEVLLDVNEPNELIQVIDYVDNIE